MTCRVAEHHLRAPLSSRHLVPLFLLLRLPSLDQAKAVAEWVAAECHGSMIRMLEQLLSLRAGQLS
jgi:hypothetical protein